MYPAPRNPALRWIAEIGSDLPEAVQRRLRAGFFTSTAPLVIGAINSIALSSVAYLRSDRPVFAAIALADLLLLALRIVLLRRVNAPSGPVFATGLLWAALQATTIVLVVASSDPAMTIIVLASGIAAIGGIIGRNFAAPRYAMAQILMIDLSFKAAFSVAHPEFLPLVLLQTVIFVLMNLSILKQQRATAIQLILGERESRRQSVTDPLTGLVNRRGLQEAFDASRAGARDRTLFYLDLDGFKQVNDRLGHAAGDTLLCEVGRRLREMVGPGGAACRLGGDEFLVLVGRLPDHDADRFGRALIAAIAAPYRIDDDLLARVGVSIGAVTERSGGLGLAEMMRRADQALYAAKTSDKGRCILYGAADAALEQAA